MLAMSVSLKSYGHLHKHHQLDTSIPEMILEAAAAVDSARVASSLLIDAHWNCYGELLQFIFEI